MSISTYATEDTIVAIATASGTGLRGTIRLSGPQALPITERVVQSSEWGEAQFSKQALRHEGEIEIADWSLRLPAACLIWPGTRSFTRQPSTEIQAWASPILLDDIVAQCVAAGARLAEPGEFTLRAFLAGRLDLAQAEAVLGVIDASGEQQLKTGLAQLSGGVGTPLQALRSTLLDLLAHLEAGLDFVEEDIEFVQKAEILEQLDAGLQSVRQLLRQISDRGEAGPAPKVVLAGPPNAGKSSLFNAICNESIALVSSIAGTTRDYVSRRLEIAGCSLELIDTAGLDPTLETSEVDQFAQSHARKQVTNADFILHCFPAGETPTSLEHLGSSAEEIRVATKCDLLASPVQTGTAISGAPPLFSLSNTTGEGIQELLEALVQKLSETTDRQDAMLVSTAQRAKSSLEDAESALQQAILVTQEDWGEELIAAEIRGALDGLGRVTGVIYTDDVLDRVFSRFCIGK
jgi:tRNA modification GTPase